MNDNMSKVVFLSFANSVYVHSLCLLEEQIWDYPLIDDFHFRSNKGLDWTFLHNFVSTSIAVAIRCRKWK